MEPAQEDNAVGVVKYGVASYEPRRSGAAAAAGALSAPPRFRRPAPGRRRYAADVT